MAETVEEPKKVSVADMWKQREKDAISGGTAPQTVKPGPTKQYSFKFEEKKEQSSLETTGKPSSAVTADRMKAVNAWKKQESFNNKDPIKGASSPRFQDLQSKFTEFAENGGGATSKSNKKQEVMNIGKKHAARPKKLSETYNPTEYSSFHMSDSNSMRSIPTNVGDNKNGGQDGESMISGMSSSFGSNNPNSPMYQLDLQAPAQEETKEGAEIQESSTPTRQLKEPKKKGGITMEERTMSYGSESHMDTTVTSAGEAPPPLRRKHISPSVASPSVATDVDTIFTEEFFEESTVNVDKFKSAMSGFNFFDLAGEVTRDASNAINSVPAFQKLSADLNNSIHSATGAITSFFGGVKALPPPEKKLNLTLPKQEAEPVEEEVAIEVEYLGDSDDEAGHA